MIVSTELNSQALGCGHSLLSSLQVVTSDLVSKHLLKSPAFQNSGCKDTFLIFTVR